MNRKCKMILTLCLAVTLLLGCTSAVAEEVVMVVGPPLLAGFEDVEPDSWYANTVYTLLEKKLVQGVGEAKFDPTGTMTRAMVVTILYRMDGGILPPGGGASFSVVPAGTWYTDAVAWGQANDIVKGMTETRFAPDAPVTREQLVTLLLRFADAGYMEDLTTRYFVEEAFTDDDPVSDWAQNAMRLAIGAGIVQGRGTANGPRWDAQSTCTRAEAATMLYRFTQLDLTDLTPQDLPEPAPEQQVKADYAAWMQAQNPDLYRDLTPENVTLIRCGTFRQGEVVMIYGSDWAFTDDLFYMEFGGHRFEFGSSGLLDCFLMYHDHTFTPVLTAYDQGLISDRELNNLEYKLYRQ